MLDTTLRRLEKKYGKYAVKGLMLYIVGTMLLLYMAQIVTVLMNIKGSILSFLNFDRSLILHGQVWRLITFIFIPPDVSPIFVAFELYFCWLFGTTLENRWGSFRFNVYYLIGTVGAIIGGLITGTASNSFLNMSLLIAFAMVCPDYRILLFFFIPIKMKWIALADAAFLILMLIFGSFGTRIMIVLSFANLLLFFGRDMYLYAADFFKRKKRRRKKTQKRAKNIDISKHIDK